MRLNKDQIKAVLSVGQKVYNYRGGVRIYYLDPTSVQQDTRANRIDYATNEIVEEQVTFSDDGNTWYDTDLENLLNHKLKEIQKQYEFSVKNVNSFEKLKNIIPERFI